jgi:hypothetical protein
MGFFAVLRDGDARPFAVSHLHLNVWALPGLLGRTVFLCDVGLRLRPSGPLTSLQLGVPVPTAANGLVDLADVMLDPAAASLVFDRPVDVHHRRTIDYGDGRLRVLRVAAASRLLDTTTTYSRWRIVLQTPAAAREECYLRLRFRGRRAGRAWRWQWSGLSRTGALVDLRVADFRETRLVPDQERVAASLVSVAVLSAFVIAPDRLHERMIRPPPRYVRLLEGRAWEPYLGRATDLRRAGKFTVWSWHATHVDADHPFRGFLDLRALPTVPVGWLAQIALTVLLAVVLAGGGAELATSPLAGALRAAWQEAAERGAAIGLTSAGAVLAWAFKHRAPLRTVLDRAARLLAALEDAVYRVRAEL